LGSPNIFQGNFDKTFLEKLKKIREVFFIQNGVQRFFSTKLAMWVPGGRLHEWRQLYVQKHTQGVELEMTKCGVISLAVCHRFETETEIELTAYKRKPRMFCLHDMHKKVFAMNRLNGWLFLTRQTQTRNRQKLDRF
jgi:hypothetical protein